MSYEGYTQNICKAGHYYERDCYEEYELCGVPGCTEPPAWSNSVDQTNGEEFGVIPDEKLDTFIISKPGTHECPTCHHVKLEGYTIYRIPTKEETREMRHAYRWDDPMHERGLVPCKLIEEEFEAKYGNNTTEEG